MRHSCEATPAINVVCTRTDEAPGRPDAYVKSDDRTIIDGSSRSLYSTLTGAITHENHRRVARFATIPLLNSMQDACPTLASKAL